MNEPNVMRQCLRVRRVEQAKSCVSCEDIFSPLLIAVWDVHTLCNDYMSVNRLLCLQLRVHVNQPPWTLGMTVRADLVQTVPVPRDAEVMSTQEATEELLRCH